jgi:hypothetical protein
MLLRVIYRDYADIVMGYKFNNPAFLSLSYKKNIF